MAHFLCHLGAHILELFCSISILPKTFIGNDALAFNPIIIKHIHFAFIKVSVYHIFLLICQ